MSTKNENSQNEQYLIWSNNKIRIVTYKSNVVKEILDCVDSTECKEIMRFQNTSVTDEKFAEFVSLAKKAGFTIYKIFKM